MRMNPTMLAFAFVVIMSVDTADAKTWTIPFPYATDGYEALRTAVEDAHEDGYEPAKIESLRLDQDRTIVSVLQRAGSGIWSMNIYIYGCDEHRCSLLAFRNAQTDSASVELGSNAAEVVVTGSDHSLILTVPLQPGEGAKP